MSDAETVLDVQAVAKRYCRTLRRSLRYGAMDIARELIGREPPPDLRRDEFWAVDGVTLRLRRGECIGLIGSNGAGKSTLLRLIAGLVKPDRGHIEVRGRVGALIDIGSGIHPLLTGLENIHLNAAILGLSRRETHQKIDKIIDFADLGDFINSPVQSFSLGMRVRLGFAVAAHLDPDLLLIDEVLAVGDAAFRARCYERIDELRRSAAIVFVSHVEQQVARLCDRTLLLRQGAPVFEGPAAEGLLAYSRDIPPPASFQHEAGGRIDCEVSDFTTHNVQLRMLVTTAAAQTHLFLVVTILSPELEPLMTFDEANPPVGTPIVRSIDLSIVNRNRVYLSLELRDEKGAILFWRHAFHFLDLRAAKPHLPAPIVMPLSTIG